MYRERRSRRARHSPETRELRQQLLKAKRRRGDKLLMRVIIFGPLLLYGAFEIGRSVFYMHGVRTFAAKIEQMSPADVKAEAQRFAHGLYSANPLIRNGAVAALKIATGWNLGPDASEWKQRWAAAEPLWVYRPASATNAPPKPEVDWRKELPGVEAAKP